MKASDCIVEYLITKKIKDVFGYPGGMVTNLMDSFYHYADHISAHVTYHEQAAALAACGYAQVSGNVGVAYATSGPGATNLITGICNAYFDSIPTIFITGQVNKNEARGRYQLRQRGFQETDIVSIVKPITKYAKYIETAEELSSELDKAYNEAMTGRKGPVLLDIPMNVFKEEVKISQPLLHQEEGQAVQAARDIRDIRSTLDIVTERNAEIEQVNIINTLCEFLNRANTPVILIGAGIKSAGCANELREILCKINIPIVSSMIAFDIMQDAPNYYGFIGAYGARTANFIVAKSDLIIAIGSRMDIRQVGINRGNFAPNAKIIRFDIDENELGFRVHNDETQFCLDLEETLAVLKKLCIKNNYSSWILLCNEMRDLLSGIDETPIASLIETISQKIPEQAVITTDVGQNQVWIAQAFKIKSGQQVLFSGGHGTMGYSLPAAIGAYYGSEGKKPVYCITGDGGMQMNIQELQFIVREHLPIKIIVLNNNALGMIRHFQEMYFEKRYFQTKPECGYTAPNFAKIAEAYGIKNSRVDKAEEWNFIDSEPELVEILINEDTYITPKLEFGKPNQDQEPLLDRDLYNRIMEMKPSIHKATYKVFKTFTPPPPNF